LYPCAPNVCLLVYGSWEARFRSAYDLVLELLDFLDEYHNVNEHVFRVVFDVFDALVATVMDQNPIKGKMPGLIQGSCSQLFGNRTSTSQ
jgi:hypothetical protein